MTMSVLVLGAGGHAKVLIEALLHSGAMIAGITDPNTALKGSELLGVPVIGSDDAVDAFPPSEILLANGLGSVGLPTGRIQLFDRFRKRGYGFATIIHPSAVVASDAEMGEGVQIMAGSVIQPGCRIGCNAIVNTRASVDHDCKIGNHAHIAPGVTLSGGVIVGEAAHIGTGATVIQGIGIGSYSLIGAGSVVIEDIRERVSAVGVPARVIKG